MVVEANIQNLGTVEKKMTKLTFILLETISNYLTSGVLYDYTKLRQLRLVEEFKRCKNSYVKSILYERQVETLEEAASLADNYMVTHKFFC